MKVIAYDVGTTGLKTCLFDISAGDGIHYVDGDTDQYGLRVLPNGGVEQDPEEWWEALARSTGRLLAKTGVPKEEIRGISFSSQMQSVVMVDEAGRALRPSMSYLDTRAEQQFARYMATGLQIEGMSIVKILRFIKATGSLSASVKDPVWKYHWVRDKEPEIFKKAYKWLDAKEYLTCRATGNMTATYDNAGLTFLYDVKKRCWSKDVCRMLDVDMDHLPGLCASTDTVGGLRADAAAELGLATDTPVFAGGGDVSLCQLGTGCTDVGDVNVYSGTSGWVCTTVDKLVLDIENKAGSIVGADPSVYNFITECETTGKCMDWAKERLERTGMSYDELFDYIRETPAGSNGVIFTPWLHGSRCPFEDPYARGIFFNISIDNRGSDMIKSVIEGVCLHMRWLLDVTEKNFKTGPAVRFAGGSAISSMVCQMLADILNKEVERVENPRNVGAMGAAALMAVSMGVIASIRDIKKIISVEARYMPNPVNTAFYDKIYPVFKKLYGNNRNLFADLNR